MKVVARPIRARAARRAPSAIGSFDGVHRGHRAVVDAVRATGLEPTVITFDPHPRIALGNRVELLTTLERRLELLEEAGVERRARRGVHAGAPAAHARGVRRALPPRDRASRSSSPARTSASAFAARAISRSSSGSGSTWSSSPELPGVSSTAIRAALADGDVDERGRDARPAVRARRRRRRRRPAGRDARLPDGEPPARAGSRVPAVRDLRRLRPRASRGDLDRDESALRRHRSGESSRTSSTSTAISTASGSSSSCGSGFATRRCSRARRRSSSRSRATSRRRSALGGRTRDS